MWGKTERAVRREVSSGLAATSSLAYSEIVVDYASRHQDFKWLLKMTVPKRDKRYFTSL
jgi:hypothetical protein